MTTRGCDARQYSDQMCCGKCGLAWDVNDQAPPECRKHQQTNVKEKHRAAGILARALERRKR